MIYRGYIIAPHKQAPMSFTVATEGKGGKIPAILDSLYTSIGIAKEAIDFYLDTKKDVKDAKANSES
jgi:hypothetical protein